MNNTNVGHNFVYNKNGKGSNFESRTGTLYSHSSVLAIKRDDIILISDYIATYSNSSSRHDSHLQKAIGYYTPQRSKTLNIYIEDIHDFFRPTYVEGCVTSELSNSIDKIKDLLLKQKRARVHNYFIEIESIIENSNKLIKFFGVDKISSIYKRFMKYSNIENLKLNYEDIIKQYDEDKKIAAKKELQKIYEKIQNFTTMSNEEMGQYSKPELNSYDFLKIKDDQLCTSQNLCVNLKEATILYKAMIKGKDIIGLKIGYYTIISHSGDYVKIGCHNILKSELKRVLN